MKGFTLVEMLLSVAILTLLTGLSLPVYETFVRRNDLDITSQTVVGALRQAATNARGVNEDSVWGVRVQASGITLFKGSSYAARDTAYDDTTVMPGSITPSGTSEVTFTKVSGAPNAAGSITLTSNTNTTRTITINAEGSVDY